MYFDLYHQYLRGMLLCGSLIIAIGGQNTFLIKQALIKTHIFVVASICFFSDVLLVSLGVFGVGSFVNESKIFALTLIVIGGIFLFLYGLMSFKSAFTSNAALDVRLNEGSKQASLRKTVIATLAITYLNPHCYLDTMVIIGGIAAPLSTPEKYAFLFGSLSVSLLWFYGVGYGLRVLNPLFKNPRAWRILEFVTGVIMWYIAIQLVRYLLVLFGN